MPRGMRGTVTSGNARGSMWLECKLYGRGKAREGLESPGPSVGSAAGPSSNSVILLAPMAA